MKKKVTIFSVVLIIILLSYQALAQEKRVEVNLVDNSQIIGRLIKISSDGVEVLINRTENNKLIPADKIDYVYFIDLNKKLYYPIKDKEELDEFIPSDLRESEDERREGRGESYKNIDGLKKFRIKGIIGSSGFGGDWYEGFNDRELTLSIGLHYFIHEKTRMNGPLIGISLANTSFDGPSVTTTVYSGYSSQKITVDTKVSITEYALEWGYAFGVSRENRAHFMYILTGIAGLVHSIEAKGKNWTTGQTSSATTDETKYALRFEVGGSIAISNSISIPISLKFDMLMGKKEKTSSSYYYSSPESELTMIGSIFSLFAGISYGF